MSRTAFLSPEFPLELQQRPPVRYEAGMPFPIARDPHAARDLLRQNLGTPLADGQTNPAIRLVNGPQPYRHNVFDADTFFRHDPALGVLRTAYGPRALRAADGFLAALHQAVTAEAGIAAGEALYRIGWRWGAADMVAFADRVAQEFEVEFERLNMGVMLDMWWWSLAAAGWGTWSYDFARARQGLMLVTVHDSAVAHTLGKVGKVGCYVYAGLFGAVFSALAKRELACVELECYSRGDTGCKFLVATPKRATVVAKWRDDGASAAEIVGQLVS